MKSKIAKSYGVLLVVFLAVVFALLLLLSPEGTAGLWRKIVTKCLLMFCVGLVGLRILMRNDKLFLNKKTHILLWSAICALTVLLSIPCIKDFYSEHEVREVQRSLCHVTNRRSLGHRYYLDLETGEEIEISANTYFSLLGLKDCDLRVEYYPNTKTAVKISGYE